MSAQALIVGTLVLIGLSVLTFLIYFRERKREMAICRALGESKRTLFQVLISELLILEVFSILISLPFIYGVSLTISDKILAPQNAEINDIVNASENFDFGSAYDPVTSGLTVTREEVIRSYEVRFQIPEILMIFGICFVVFTISGSAIVLFALQGKPKKLLM